MSSPLSEPQSQATPVIEPKRLVRAAPTSRVALRCPSVRTGTITHNIERADGTARRVRVTATVALELVDDLYPGRYVMREITIADGDGGGLSPELIRSIRYTPMTMQLTSDGLVDVTIEPDGRIIDHRAPDLTLSDENLARHWMMAKLCDINTNGFIAASFNITRAAAAQRIARLRREGMLPAADGPGARR